MILALVGALPMAVGCDSDPADPDSGTMKVDSGMDSGSETDGGGDAGGDGGKADVNESTQAAIKVADGGEVKLEDGELVIPANSIQSDDDEVTITMAAKTPPETLPNQDTLYGLYYEFGPEGLQFDPAAVLTLPLPADLGGKTPVVSFYNATTKMWEDLPSKVVGDKIEVTIRHFSGYGVRLLNDAACSFTGCGG
ncbi:MAG: hypothetical protein KC416_11660, partial [Myxococcales bacterium]|nr:hypothetical protein [Myxococcales bacterium]